MPIVNFTFKPSDLPADAQNVRAYHENAGYNSYDGENWVIKQGPSAIWTWDTWVGLCLEDREYNMRDDSDFYMIVWNPEKQAPEKIVFASTRCWSYPAYASRADATPAVRAMYDKWLENQSKIARNNRRRADIIERLEARNARREICKQYNLPYGRMIELYLHFKKKYQQDDFERILKLLSSNIRSPFKKSLRDQVIKWFNTENPSYKTPLSYKQIQYL